MPKQSKPNRLALLGKIWKDPVWSKVIAAGILAMVALAGAQFQIIRQSAGKVWSISRAVFAFELSIPVWLFVLGFLLLVIYFRIKKKLEKFFADIPQQDMALKYNNDHIFDIDWHWESSRSYLNPRQIAIENLTPRCPKCKARLEVSDYSGRLVACITERCDWVWPRLRSGNYNALAPIRQQGELFRQVEREIDRKLVAGEYPGGSNSGV